MLFKRPLNSQSPNFPCEMFCVIFEQCNPVLSCALETNYSKYQGVKEFHMLARIGCYCNIMVFSPFNVKVTYYHPLNQWLLRATNDNQGQTVMDLQCSETINHS